MTGGKGGRHAYFSFRDHEQLFAATCCHRAVDATFTVTLSLPFGSRPSPRSGTVTRGYLIFAMKNSKEQNGINLTTPPRHPSHLASRRSNYCLARASTASAFGQAEEGLEQDAASHCNQPN